MRNRATTPKGIKAREAALDKDPLESIALDLESEDSARVKKLRRAEAQIHTREKRKAKDADLDKEVIPSRFSSSSLNSGSHTSAS